MITVRYSDEPDPITYSNDKDRELFEAVKSATGATIREICVVGRAIILSDLDPIKADSAPFIWPKPPEPDFWWINPSVRAPDGNVCVIEALNHWMTDTDACKRVLDVDDSIEATVRVLRNTISWLKFWSVRARTPELRGWYSDQLKLRLAGLTQLREKALRTTKVGLVGVANAYKGHAGAGPGGGNRTIYPTGSQLLHGKPAPGVTNKSPDPPATGSHTRDTLAEFGRESRRR
jgi:hypothetical protein